MLVASVVAIRRDGPAAPVLTARPAAHGGAVVGLRPDGAGRATVVVTDRAGTLLRILAWDRRVGGPVSLAWDGRLSDGRSAPAGTYQVRAFTVDAEGRASDPAVAEVGTHR
jgi:flagellar hook assembly protein FlgD